MFNKKLDGCAKEHIKIEMKSNKNLVLKFSTTAYEFAKASITDFLESNIFQSEFAYSEEKTRDERGVIVETRFKAVNKKGGWKSWQVVQTHNKLLSHKFKYVNKW